MVSTSQRRGTRVMEDVPPLGRDQHLEVGSRLAPASGATNGLSSAVILFVEHGHPDQSVFMRALAQHNLFYTSVTAPSLEEARRAMTQLRFDIVIFDGDFGLETAFGLIGLAGSTPVIVVINAGDDEAVSRLWSAGAYDCLVKDQHNRYLRRLPIVVENILRRKASLQKTRHAKSERLQSQTIHELIHGVAHDLRTPLTVLGASTEVVRLQAELLQESALDAGAVQDAAAMILSRCDSMATQQRRLEESVRSLVALIELDALSAIKRSDYDLVTLTRQIVDRVQPQAAEQGVNLRFAAPAELVSVQVAPREYTLMIENLLKCALERTSRGGVVDVRLANGSAGAVKLTISESDPRGLLAPATSSDRESSRLGMAIADRVIDLHGGALEVENLMGGARAVHITFPQGFA